MNCDKCNRNMDGEPQGDLPQGRHYSAVSVVVDDNPDMKKIYPELDLPFQVNLCYVCWLNGCGFPILLKDGTTHEFK